MFFEGDRIVSFRRFILVAEDVKRLRAELEAAGDSEAKAAPIRAKLAGPQGQYEQALAELLPLQRGDFEGLFRALGSLPVTIRLLDPPLHEFLPQEDANQQEMARTMGIDVSNDQADRLQPCTSSTRCSAFAAAGWASPYPELSAMQVRAIIEAALVVSAEGVKPRPGDHDPAGRRT